VVLPPFRTEKSALVAGRSQGCGDRLLPFAADLLPQTILTEQKTVAPIWVARRPRKIAGPAAGPLTRGIHG